MAESENNEKTMFGRFYTSARKFKRRLGALPDGSKIWGGPYTYTQFTVMGVVGVLGWLTREILGSSNAVTDTVLIILVAYGAGLVAGKAPEGKRSIISYLSSLMALVNHPGEGGKYKGRPIRLSAKARTIQREQRQQKKREAKNPTLGSQQSQLPSVKDINPAPAGYGSSLNRLLNEYGLESATEGKQSW